MRLGQQCPGTWVNFFRQPHTPCRGDMALSLSLRRVEMRTFLKRFFSDESGLELVEYTVMTALLVAALVTASS